LTGPEIEITDNTAIFINGKETIVGISSHHFESVNIIGMDFLMATKELKYCFPKMGEQSVTFHF
jgi:hypothetical protein